MKSSNAPKVSHNHAPASQGALASQVLEMARERMDDLVHDFMMEIAKNRAVRGELSNACAWAAAEQEAQTANNLEVLILNLSGTYRVHHVQIEGVTVESFEAADDAVARARELTETVAPAFVQTRNLG